MVSTDLLPYIYGSLCELQLTMITMAPTGIIDRNFQSLLMLGFVLEEMPEMNAP